MDLFSTVVENHLARIHIVEGIFLRAMYTTADIIIEEAVEYIVIIESLLSTKKMDGVKN